MNKKGFIRIIEAIFAVVIVFAFIIFAFGDVDKSAAVPYEVEQIQEKIIGEITNNIDDRKCILGIDNDMKECGKTLIEGYIPPNSLLEYSYEIIQEKPGVDLVDANLLVNKNEINLDIPDGKDIYAKSIIVSVDDVLSPGYTTPDEDNKYHRFTMFFWYKI